MEKTVCLTTAQALLKFLNQQYISIDGKETPYVEGIFHVYGHGNVLGIGQALELEPGHLKSYSGKMSRNGPCGYCLCQTEFTQENFCRINICWTGRGQSVNSSGYGIRK